jgi:ATP synthase protein I
VKNRKDAGQPAYQQLGPLLSAGMVFPVSIAVGYAMGYYLDRWLGTGFLTIVFLLFGIAAGFISFFRAVAAADRASGDGADRKPQDRDSNSQ